MNFLWSTCLFLDNCLPRFSHIQYNYLNIIAMIIIVVVVVVSSISISIYVVRDTVFYTLLYYFVFVPITNISLL